MEAQSKVLLHRLSVLFKREIKQKLATQIMSSQQYPLVSPKPQSKTAESDPTDQEMKKVAK